QNAQQRQNGHHHPTQHQQHSFGSNQNQPRGPSFNNHHHHFSSFKHIQIHHNNTPNATLRYYNSQWNTFPAGQTNKTGKLGWAPNWSSHNSSLQKPSFNQSYTAAESTANIARQRLTNSVNTDKEN